MTIGALALIATAIPFVFFPAQSLTLVGWPPPSNSTIVLARDGGLLMFTLAIVDWVGRNATGPVLVGLIWANIFLRVTGAVVNAWEYAVGLTPTTVLVGLAAAIVVDLLLIVMFLAALQGAGRRSVAVRD
jgi:hypothetical protein